MESFEKERAVETYKSLIQFSIETMKTLLLLNGGAVVALLAYLGNITNKGSCVPDMRWPMGAFITGLFFCGLTFILSYLTQLRLHQENMSGRKEGFFTRHQTWLNFAAGSAILSVVCFICGSIWAVCNFQ